MSTATSNLQSDISQADSDIGAKKGHSQRAPAKLVGTASNKVMGIFELVEMVLMHLPPKDLIAVQRVNTTWNNASKQLVKKSPYLNAALSTSPVISRGYIDIDSTGCPSYSPIKTYYNSKAICQIHPALRLETRHAEQPEEMVLSISPSYLLSWRPGVWRDMFLTQPPVLRSDIYSFEMGPAPEYTMFNRHRAREREEANDVCNTITEEGPVTLAHLHDVASKLTRGQELMKSRYSTPLKVVIKRESIGAHRYGCFIAEGSPWVTTARKSLMQMLE